MNKNINIKWMGMDDPKKPAMPMVWGYMEYIDSNSSPNNYIGVKYFAFWASVGGRILFHEHSNGWHLQILQQQKENKGFEAMAPGALKRTMWKNFDEDFTSSFIAYKLEHF